MGEIIGLNKLVLHICNACVEEEIRFRFLSALFLKFAGNGGRNGEFNLFIAKF